MKSRKGINALELLIIVVVICAFVAVGVPMFHRGANSAVLDANVQSLGSMVNERVAEGYSPVYKPSGEGDPQLYASTSLEESLAGSGAPVYTNPFVGRQKGTQVVNSHTLSFGPGFVAPAVLITDWGDCQYATFPELPPGFRRLLAGTLVVSFNSTGGTIDVYFVDQHGQRSVTVISVPTGPVRADRYG